MAAPASDSPRVRVAALILLQGRVVLVRHVKDTSRYHLLPGGGVEHGETLADALRREVEEETGLRIRVVRPLFINDTIAPDGSRHVINLTFWAEPESGSISDSPQDPRVEAVDLADIDHLDRLDLRPPLASAIQEAVGSGLDRLQARYLGALFVEAP